MKQRLLAVLVSLVMALSLTVPAFAAPEDETSETTNATTTTRVTTSKDTSDEAIARATAEGGEEDDEADRLIIEALVIFDRIFADSDDHKRDRETGNTDVGEGKTFADSGCHHLFAFPDQFSELGFIQRAASRCQCNDFLKYGFFCGSLECEDAIRVEILQKFCFHVRYLSFDITASSNNTGNLAFISYFSNTECKIL